MKEKGTIVFPDGSAAYEGEIEDGHLEGEGKLYYRRSGSLHYEGQWRRNLPEGQGKQYDPNGAVRYEGEWKEGLREGKGRLFDETGKLKYEGDWKEGCVHGTGTLYYAASDRVAYIGEFRWDQRKGSGEEYREDDGSLAYKGEWKENRPDGQGIKYHPNGERWYEGTFRAGESSGYGKAYYEDGKLAYDGNWKNGLRHGRGKLLDADGHLEYYGLWKDGEVSESLQWEEAAEPETLTLQERRRQILERFENAPRMEKSGLFEVTIASCLSPFFLPFSDADENWNPFIATLKQYEAQPDLTYEDSLLKQFYESYPRENLQQSFLLPTGVELNPLWELKARAIFPLPWGEPEAYAEFLLNSGFIKYGGKGLPVNKQNVAEVSRMVFDFYLNRKFSTWVPQGEPGMAVDMNRPGFTEFGPVAQNEGEAVFRKLTEVYESVRTIGYLPGLFPGGRISGKLLIRPGEYRFVVETGLFLLAALAALGHDTVRVSFSSKDEGIIERDRLIEMPFVEKGVYSEATANLLFDHAFLSFKKKLDGR